MPTIIEENAVVLVMERGNEDVKLITSLLHKAGFGVLQTTNQAEILELCSNGDATASLVIVDAATPGTAGIVEQVRAANSAVRILLIGASRDSEPVTDWSLKNVQARLSRPFRRAQFLGSVLELAHQPLVRTA